MENISFQVTYNNKNYTFEFGSEVYIFHTGIYNKIDKKYSIKELLNYVRLVHECYLKDTNRTPLGELCDYVAQHWKKLKKKGRYEILEEFYSAI